MIAFSTTVKGDIQEKLRMTFKTFNNDKNSKIDKKELEKIIEAIYDLMGEENRKGENAPSARVKRTMLKLGIN
jgi:Ca2+-binding EF-hand superfamily protein